ncbi:hypothetical protein HYPGJ_30693 [Hyphomicrobium sp. GJ21]|nr:hypothetical protein HYPGJ_30693 [Hyphomicrobium sp. GJ21]
MEKPTLDSAQRFEITISRFKLIDDYRQLIEPSRQFSIGEYLHS